MHVRRTLSSWYGTLTNPAACFAQLHRQTLETLIVEYLTLLCALAVAVWLFMVLISVARALLYSLLLGVGVNELLLANYALAGATGAAFFTLFAGTFLLFVVSMLLSALYRDVAYVDVLRVLLVAATPLLLFGWIVPFSAAFLIWGVVLFVGGIPAMRIARKQRRGTIGERE